MGFCNFNLLMNNPHRINECRDMEEYHTSMSLKATKDGESVKAKEHARKAQAYRQELNKLLSSADKI